MQGKNYGPLAALKPEEFKEIIALPEKDKHKYLISGYVDFDEQHVMCFRGSGTSIAIPFSVLPPSGTGLKPDFDSLEFIDHGQTLKLGEYEASVDAILYEVDEEYRKEVNNDINTWEGQQYAARNRKKILN